MIDYLKTLFIDEAKPAMDRHAGGGKEEEAVAAVMDFTSSIEILAEKTFEGFAYNSSYGVSLVSVTPSPCGELVKDATYKVVWDGVEYQSIAKANSGSGCYLGNDAWAGGANSGEPFIISIPNANTAAFMSSDPDATSHTVAIYQSTGGVADNMVIVPPAGKVLSSVVIEKPETLIPENVAEGVDIAGIVGTLASGGAVFDWGTFTSSSTGRITVPHKLGVMPDAVFIVSDVGNVTDENSYFVDGCAVSQALANKYSISPAYVNRMQSSGTMTSVGDYTLDSPNEIMGSIGATDSDFSVGASRGLYHMKSDATYTYFAIGGLV